MNIENFFNLLLSNPENLSIEYSYVNGDEKLVVNGEEVTTKEETFDNTEIKNIIKTYEDNLEMLDDCLFLEIVEELGECMDLNSFNKSLEKESLTKEEAQNIKETIESVNGFIKEKLIEKAENIKELIERF